MREIAVCVLAGIGLLASLSGAVGVVRMPDVYTRIQCASKPIAMGSIPVLVALVVGEGVITPYASRALIVGFLILIVNPAASHALSRSAYKAGIDQWEGAVADEPRARQHEDR